MKNRRHSPEQVIRELAEADRLLAQGESNEEVARHLEISEAIFHRWRDHYGWMKADDAKELRELRKENGLVRQRRQAGCRGRLRGCAGQIVPAGMSSKAGLGAVIPIPPSRQLGYL
jgi:putative transposase